MQTYSRTKYRSSGGSPRRAIRNWRSTTVYYAADGRYSTSLGTTTDVAGGRSAASTATYSARARRC